MKYTKYTDEQLEQARSIDLVDMLSRYGYTFKKAGEYYECKEHDSLVIYPDRRGFVWNSKKIVGSSAIDWLMKVESMKFTDAVKELIGNQDFHIAAPQAPNKKAKKLVLPKPIEAEYKRIFAYLIKTRYIAREVVQHFVDKGSLYQDVKGNCVFVGFDEQNKPKFGCVRGTLSNVQYRGDCDGSDKRYSFSMDGKNKQKLYIFESPIDLMSHCTIINQNFKNSSAFLMHCRLSLSGTSDVALEHYLKTHPDVRELNFRLDNDEAGHKATETLMQKYAGKGYIVHYAFPKTKDINQDLFTKEVLREYVAAQASNTPSKHRRR